MPYEILELYDEEQPQQEPYNAQQEGIPGFVGRNIARTGSRILETLGGIPKSSSDILQSVSEFIPESIKGSLSQGLSIVNPAASFIPKAVQTIGQFLPSQENIHEKIAGTTQPGYLEPQGTGEEIADSITQTVTSLLLGKAKIPGIPTSAKGALQSLGNTLKTVGKATGAASAGKAAKFLSKKLGAGELGQEITDIGTTLLVGAGLDSNMETAAQKIYKVRDEAVKPGDGALTQNILKKTHEARDKFLDVGIKNLSGKPELRDLIDSIEDSIIHNNKIPLEKLVPLKQQAGTLQYKLKYDSPEREWVKQIKNTLNETLKDPKMTGNKVFSDAQKAGDQLYTHVKSAKKINNWAKSAIAASPILSGGAAGAVFGFLNNPVAALQNAALGLAGGTAFSGTVYGTLKSGLLMKNILINPSVRKEYGHMVLAASKQNMGQFIKSAEKFNKAFDKSVTPQYEILELY